MQEVVSLNWGKKMHNVVELNDENFDKVVLNSLKPVLVEFYAPWCGYCKTQTQIIEEFANEIGDKAVIAKLNVDESPLNPEKYCINGIPAILLFQKGKLVLQKAGVHKKDELKDIIARFI